MGGPTQLFKYMELKALNAKEGEKLKKRALAAITAEAAKDISRVIIVVRTQTAGDEAPKKKTRPRKKKNR